MSGFAWTDADGVWVGSALDGAVEARIYATAPGAYRWDVWLDEEGDRGTCDTLDRAKAAAAESARRQARTVAEAFGWRVLPADGDS